MKLINLISLLTLFFHSIYLNSQCKNFEDGNLVNWKHNQQINDLSIITDNNSKVLYFRDGSGGSIVYNDSDFRGNWIQIYQNKCISFDYKIDYDHSVQANNNYAPKIYIYSGNAAPLNGNNWPNNQISRAVFTSAISVNNDNVWKHYELPVGPSSGGLLPSNNFGKWSISTPIPSGETEAQVWDNLIQNVRGIILPGDYNNSPSEKIYFDNFCFENCTALPVTPTYPACCPPILKEDLASLINFEGNLNNFTPEVILTPEFKQRLQAYINYRKALDPCFTEFTVEYYIKRPVREPDIFDFAITTNLSRGATTFRPNQTNTTTWGQATLSDITLQSNKWYRFGISFYGGPIECREAIQKDCSIWWIDFKLNKTEMKTATSSGKTSKMRLSDIGSIK